jgi:tetratricopeptide (TPR) repeat protein
MNGQGGFFGYNLTTNPARENHSSAYVKEIAMPHRWPLFLLILALACFPFTSFAADDAAWDPAGDTEPLPWQVVLEGEDAERVAELEERVDGLELEGRFDEAVPLAHEIHEIRSRVQGDEHWRTGDARRRSNRLLRAAHLSDDERAVLAEAIGAGEMLGALVDGNQYTEARVIAENRLEVFNRVFGEGDAITLAATADHGFLLLRENKTREAESALEAVIDKQVGLLGNEHPNTLTSRDHYCLALNALGHVSRALVELDEVLTLRTRVLGEEDPATLTSMMTFSRLALTAGRPEEAEATCRRVIDVRLRRLGPDHPKVLEARGFMPRTIREQGRLADAIAAYRICLDEHLRVFGEDHPDTLTATSNLGLGLKAAGRYAEAGAYIRDALTRCRRLRGDRHQQTLMMMNNLANLLHPLGRGPEAAALYEETIEGVKALFGPTNPKTLLVMNNAANLLRDMGRLEESRELLEEVLAALGDGVGPEHRVWLHSVNNLARVHKDAGEYDAAEPLVRQVLEARIEKFGTDHKDVYTSMKDLGELLESAGRLEEAEPFLRQALEGRAALFGEGHLLVLHARVVLARLHERMGKREQALAGWWSAAETLEKARLKVSFTGLGRALLSGERSPQLPLASGLAGAGKPVEAWQAFESGLARGLLDAMSWRNSRPLTADERDREENLAGRLNRVEERLGRLSGKSGDDVEEKTRQLAAERDQLQAELVAFEAEMAAKYGAAAGGVYGLEQVQAALASDMALLGWVDTDWPPAEGGGRWACVVRHTGSPVWVMLPGSGKDGIWTPGDDEVVAALRRSLQQRALGPDLEERRRLVKSVFDQRLLPVMEHLEGIERLVVLPAGRMAGIPVEVLTDRFTVSYAPSATLFTWLREDAGDRAADQGPRLLALGDPVFSPRGDRLPDLPQTLPDHGAMLTTVASASPASAGGLLAGDVILDYNGSPLTMPGDLDGVLVKTTAANGGETSIPVTVWRNGETLELLVAAGDLGIRTSNLPADEALRLRYRLDSALSTTRGETFDPLPGSRLEVQAIADLFGGGNPEDPSAPMLLLGYEASEGQLQALAQEGKLARFDYLHFATHGVLDDQVAMNSALVLSAGEDGTDDWDDRITAGQVVRSWKLDAELVTLSGCRTGLGRASGGEGFLGFSQAFFAAGARNLLLSLWDVDDRATMLLMRRFYENLLGHRGTAMSQAGALREAKQWLRELTVADLRGMDLEARLRGAGEQEPAGAGTGHRPFEDPWYWAAFVLLGAG